MRIISKVTITVPESADVDLKICQESIIGGRGLCSDPTETVCSHGIPHLENEFCESVCNAHEKKIRCVRFIKTCAGCAHVNICIKQNNMDAKLCDDFIMYRPKIIVKELK